MKKAELIEGASGARGVLTFLVEVGPTRETCVNEFFTELYEGSCTALRASIKKLLDSKRDGELYKISFFFEASEEGEILNVKRRIKAVFGKKIILDNTENARFVLVDRKYIKALKNGKKQRFIPLRNNKNCKNKE